MGRVKTVRLYKPHSGQLDLHEHTSFDKRTRFRIACCGRRFGKTMACANEIIEQALNVKSSNNWWVSPTYQQSMIAYRMVENALGATGLIVDNLKSEKRITLVNGSSISFKSADNFNALRGEGVNFLVIDEAATIQREAWEQALRPTLSDKNGRALIVGTPKGRNWFYELFARGNDPEQPDYKSYSFPTWTNPLIPSSEIEEVRRSLPSDVFRQEYEAQFLEDSAGVFRNIRECVTGSFQEPVRGKQYFIGWDIAKHQDFSVLVCMDSNRHVVAFDRFNQIDYSLQLSRVQAMAEKYRASVLMDSTGAGDPVLEQLRIRGVSVEGYNLSNQSKQQLIEHLAVGIEQRLLTFPQIDVLINELQIYEYEMTRAGNVRYNAPSGFHDDTVIALALAYWKSKATPAILF
jgi:hypothetical protein